MKRNSYIISLIAAALLLFGSCEDFLEEKPQAQETTNSFLGDPATTEANFEVMLHAAYSVYTISEGTWLSNRHWFENMISDWMSDDCEKGGNGSSDMPEMLDMRSWSAIPMNSRASHYETPWLVGYLGAGRANTILVLLEDYKDNLTPVTYNRIKGECLFIRGYYYFMMAKCFGSVPYFEKPVTPDDYYNPEKQSPEALYALIEADLAMAVTLLPEQNSTDWGTVWPHGRATKGAARAVLARILTMEIGFEFNGKTWQDVYDVTQAIISSDVYDLQPNYAEIFEDEGAMGVESIFEIPCADLGGGYGSPGGNMQQRMTTLRPGTDFPPGPNTPTGGWGFSTPTQNLFDTFEPGDPRKECTITADGDFFMGDTIHAAIADICPDGYWSRKYAGPDPRLNTMGDKNVRLIRYAEVLLTHAEAAYYIGAEGEALTNLQLVRARAQASSGPKGSIAGEIDTYPTPEGTLADITATGGQDLLDAIKHERRVELAIEGNRTWDLYRWGVFENILANEIIPNDYFLNTLDPNVVRANFRSHLIDGIVPSLPIPADEIETYGIIQNPGY